jgi:signal transduction histidine kinase
MGRMTEFAASYSTALLAAVTAIAVGALLLAAGFAARYWKLKKQIEKAQLHDATDVGALTAEIEKRKAAELELRAAKDDVERASYAKSQFLANMSHELRTPLNAIIGFAEVIAGEVSGPVGTPIYKEYASEIAAGGKQLFEILSNILDMARIEAGKAGISESEFSLVDAIDFAVRSCGGRRESKSIDVLCDAALRLRADERMIRQALSGLISNALKFSPAGGRVLVRAEIAHGALDICVQDNGSGIPFDKHEHVLEPFNQLHDVLTRRTGGLGLGLPLANALVTLHGGSLSFQRAGEGTLVRVRLPLTRLVEVPGMLAAAIA